MSIVADSEGICARLDAGIAPEEAPTSTPEMVEATSVPANH
jgi:hypothetical protein